jgi:hypothetical protein
MNPIGPAPSFRPWIAILAVHLGFGAGWWAASRAAPSRPATLGPAAVLVHAAPRCVAERPSVVEQPSVVELDRPFHYCRVDRLAIERLLHDGPGPIAGSARLVPSLVDGRAAGVKIYAIRPGSLPARLGLRNGDRIERINGVSLDAPDRYLEVYVQLRQVNRVTVDIERAGAPVRLVYDIV